MWVDYDFPEVMGIPVTEGRTFRKEDKLQLKHFYSMILLIKNTV